MLSSSRGKLFDGSVPFSTFPIETRLGIISSNAPVKLKDWLAVNESGRFASATKQTFTYKHDYTVDFGFDQTFRRMSRRRRPFVWNINERRVFASASAYTPAGTLHRAAPRPSPCRCRRYRSIDKCRNFITVAHAFRVSSREIWVTQEAMRSLQGVSIAPIGFLPIARESAVYCRRARPIHPCSRWRGHIPAPDGRIARSGICTWNNPRGKFVQLKQANHILRQRRVQFSTSRVLPFVPKPNGARHKFINVKEVNLTHGEPNPTVVQSLVQLLKSFKTCFVNGYSNNYKANDSVLE